MSNEHQAPDLPGGQLSLLPDHLDEAILMQSELASGICSGVQLKSSDPDRYMMVCTLLADGSLSQRQISRLTGTSRNLVSAINRMQAADIEPLKQRIASRARNLGQLCLERAEEIVQSGDKISLRDLAILAGVAIDKSQLLSGEATQRIEAIDSSSGADQFEAQFQRLQQADVIEMGSAGEISAAKGGDSGGDHSIGLGGFGGGSGDCAADDGCLDDDDKGGQNER